MIVKQGARGVPTAELVANWDGFLALAARVARLEAQAGIDLAAMEREEDAKAEQARLDREAEDREARRARREAKRSGDLLASLERARERELQRLARTGVALAEAAPRKRRTRKPADPVTEGTEAAVVVAE